MPKFNIPIKKTMEGHLAPFSPQMIEWTLLSFAQLKQDPSIAIYPFTNITWKQGQSVIEEDDVLKKLKASSVANTVNTILIPMRKGDEGSGHYCLIVLQRQNNNDWTLNYYNSSATEDTDTYKDNNQGFSQAHVKLFEQNGFNIINKYQKTNLNAGIQSCKPGVLQFSNHGCGPATIASALVIMGIHSKLASSELKCAFNNGQRLDEAKEKSLMQIFIAVTKSEIASNLQHPNTGMTYNCLIEVLPDLYPLDTQQQIDQQEIKRLEQVVVTAVTATTASRLEAPPKKNQDLVVLLRDSKKQLDPSKNLFPWRTILKWTAIPLGIIFTMAGLLTALVALNVITGGSFTAGIVPAATGLIHFLSQSSVIANMFTIVGATSTATGLKVLFAATFTALAGCVGVTLAVIGTGLYTAYSKFRCSVLSLFTESEERWVETDEFEHKHATPVATDPLPEPSPVAGPVSITSLNTSSLPDKVADSSTQPSILHSRSSSLPNLKSVTFHRELSSDS